MTYHTGLSRDGPALLVRDLMAAKSDDELRPIAHLAPDILVLQNVDFDHDRIAAHVIQTRLAGMGHEMPFSYTTRPNTGIGSGADLDRNGKLEEPRDMLGYGRFAGQGGMLLLSRFPLVDEQTRDLSHVLWRDQETPDLPAGGFFPDGVLAILPLHTVNAWDVVIQTPTGPLRVLTSHASTPAFDGPEDRNGLRNAAELRFWRRYIEQPALQQMPFVLLGTLNNDPLGGEGHRTAIQSLLNHDALQDPHSTDANGGITAEWAFGLALRVDYVLPSSRLRVRAAKVERTPRNSGESRHYPVWVDVTLQ